MNTGKIIYTKVDEAPGLATYSLLPIIKAFTGAAGVSVETRDISLAGRTAAKFPDRLTEEQRVPDDLAELGKLVKLPEANVIKLPCISASIPQLKATIKELQEKGYNLPDYPEAPKTDEEKTIKATYDTVKGSAVNPVLREGNSDRRAPGAVKNYAKKHPHPMGEWTANSKSHVAHMNGGDFFSNEKSVVITAAQAGDAKIIFTGQDGTEIAIKEKLPLLAGEIIDGTFMSQKALRSFLAEQIDDAKANGTLFSVHLKATMMKVSDPIMFGHCVSVFYQDVFSKHDTVIKELGVNVNNGLSDLYARIETLPAAQRAEIEADLAAVYQSNCELAMVDSSKGITNLHVPNNVIVDASMPVVIRDGGRMWGPDDKLHDCIAMVPDRCYATIYQEAIEDCQQHGAFDPATMGSVANVGLMAQKAE
ncbi:MAG: NADP-dependent isocitrate dehydrogenase, partial [Thermoplasmata archaeon]|nr:NADP-dependent isocitrate dehydrogenase [Thermoplasmata archaeon]